MLALKKAGAVTFDYGNNIRKMAYDAGCKDAFEIQALCLSTSVHFSAKERSVSLGALSATLPTFKKPTISRLNFSR